jgi:glycosyltransferase involved in cell wall biosynthesis
MSFANHYLSKQRSAFHIPSETPYRDLKYCIVIPCYNEDRLIVTLDSLWQCQRPGSGTEVIIVVNSSESDIPAVLDQNLRTIEEFKIWKSSHADPALKFHLIHVPDLPVKHAGAGMARKTGMDTAIYRFNLLNRQNGIIISLDADCTCDKNYLLAIESAFKEHVHADCAILYFEHPLSGNDYPGSIYSGIRQYELHLRYHIESLRHIKYPFAHHTLGSCFAVKAGAYVRQGGMNRKKAGEDFYFLQKIFTSGYTTEINNTTVYPSPRPSARVPFGTGPVIQKMLSSDQQVLMTYNPQTYKDLGVFLKVIPEFYRISNSDQHNLLLKMPEPVREFLLTHELEQKIAEVNGNTGNCKAFTKRFYNWFNGLMLIKYLNYCHAAYCAEVPVEKAAYILLQEKGLKPEHGTGITELLKAYRKIQQGQDYTILL